MVKIVETVERECCNPGTDIKPYKGKPLPGFAPNAIKNMRLSFCMYCGQLWLYTRRAGEMDAGWEKVTNEDLK